MLNSLIKNLLVLSCAMCVFNLKAQDYSWKVDVALTPVNVFFDGTPLYETGNNTGFKLRSFNLFNDRFKESRSIAISKLFGKNQIQLSYATYSNSFDPSRGETGQPAVFARYFKDFSINYLRNYAQTPSQKFSFAYGVGLTYRNGFEMLSYEPWSFEGEIKYYYLQDLGLNVMHRTNYNISKSFTVFTQFNLYSRVLHKATDPSEFNNYKPQASNYNPSLFNFSLGFGVSYNFNFKQKL